MKALRTINSQAIVWAQQDIDTDVIIPAQFLTTTERSGLGQHVFHRMRQKDSDFPFNQKHNQNRSVFVAGDNFGCGSSREHAVWALMDWGIKAVIAPGFADIFSNNARKNGLLLITLEAPEWHQVHQAALADDELMIDIESQQVMAAEQQWSFDMDPFFKSLLINGLDELAYLLHHQTEIENLQQQLSRTQYLNNRRTA